MTSSGTAGPPRGNEAFKLLRAEREGGWLASVYLEQPDFGEILSSRSIVVYGESGSGKTGLRLSLAQRALQSSSLHPLIVDWHPPLRLEGRTNSAIVDLCVRQIMANCAESILRLFARTPQLFSGAPAWVQDMVVWFIRRYLPGDLRVLIGRAESEGVAEAQSVLQDILHREQVPVIKDDAEDEFIIRNIAEAVQTMGAEAIWVMVDGLEPLAMGARDIAVTVMNAVFSTLSLFEEPYFLFKIVAPLQLQPILDATGGVKRARLARSFITWDQARLIKMAEKRLQGALGRDGFTLADLCSDPGLIKALTTNGGQTPRGWLEMLQPLVTDYLERRTNEPCSAEHWAELSERNLPQLQVDSETGEVTLGFKIVENMQPEGYRLLLYLYEQRPHVCPRRELYFRAHLQHETVPRSQSDEGWEAAKTWGPIIDSALWRLRQRIETDPAKPRYVLTARGRGIYLENTW